MLAIVYFGRRLWLLVAMHRKSLSGMRYSNPVLGNPNCFNIRTILQVECAVQWGRRPCREEGIKAKQAKKVDTQNFSISARRSSLTVKHFPQA